MKRRGFIGTCLALLFGGNLPAEDEWPPHAKIEFEGSDWPEGDGDSPGYGDYNYWNPRIVEGWERQLISQQARNSTLLQTLRKKGKIVYSDTPLETRR